MTFTVWRRCSEQRADVGDLPECRLNRRQRVPADHRQQRHAVCGVHRVGLALRDLVAPDDTGAHVGRGQHLPDVAVLHELGDMSHIGRCDRLRSDHRQRLVLTRQVGHLDRFAQSVAERPFAVDALAVPDRSLDDPP